MTTRANIDQLLVELNPLPASSQPSQALDRRAEADLRRILSSPGPAARQRLPQKGRKVGTRLAIAAALVLVASVGFQMTNQNRGDTALAATPPLLPTAHRPIEAHAPAQLRHIADRVAKLPDDTGHGDVAEIRTQSWNLFTRVDEGQASSAVVAQDKTTRITSAKARKLGQPFGSLSADPQILQEQLSTGHAQQGAAGRFDAVVEAYRLSPIDPDTRAAMLRYLADTKDIAAVGKVTDRVGRPGLGFTIHSRFTGLPTRYMVIISPTTGRLLDYEETMTGKAGNLNVRTPAVISYIVWKSAKYID